MPVFFVLSFALICIGTALFTVLRAVFAVVHWEVFRSLSTSTLAMTFLHGGRFDFAAVCQLALPALFITLLLDFWTVPARLRRAAQFTMIVPLLASLLIYGADLHYFSDAGRRLSYEIFLLRNDVGAVMSMSASYSWTVAAVVSAAAFLVWIWRRIVQFVERRFAPHSPLPANLAWFFVLTTVMVVGLRGGVQSKPLRPSFAYFSTNHEAGQLALNPVFTVTYALRKGRVSVPRFMPPKAAIERVQNLLRRDGWHFALDRFPIYQSVNKKTPMNRSRPNIVVMVLESWSGADVGALNDGRGVTPQFDALAAKGTLFTNFYAVGHRSTDGITAVCLGLPTFEDLQIIGSSLEQNRFRGLGRILAEQGYATLFLHGAKIGSMGLNGFARVVGFDRYLGKEDFDLLPGDTDDTWGVYDHVALRRLNAEMRSMPQPFCALWFSLSSHSPYQLPSERYRVTPVTVPDHDFIDALRYSDESIGNFFAVAKNEPYFHNTVFVLVADHTAGSQLKGTVARTRIPLLIYSPERVPAKKVARVGSQLDILPTILDMTGILAPHHALGRSLFDSSASRFAFVDLGYSQGWFENNRLTMLENGSTVGDNETSQENLKAFVQVSKSLILENHLAP